MAGPRPVDERDHTAGPAGAPVTLIEYGDFECPYCGAAFGELHELRRRAGGRLRFVFRHFPLDAVHPNARAAAEAAEAAAAQGRFWEMHDALFTHQRALGPDDLRGYAEALGLDLRRFDAELASGGPAERVAADAADGERAGVSGTPALFIDGGRHTGFYDAETLEQAVEDAEARRGGA